MQPRGRLVLAGGACLIAFLLAACGGGESSPSSSAPPPPPPPAPDFSLSVSPGSISVEQGATSGAATVAVNPINDFTGSVSIAVEGLPAGVTSSPASPFSVGAGQSQQVTFSASTSVVDGSYALTLRGTSGALSFTATLTLTVTPRPDFSLSVSPNSTSVEQGATSAAVTVTVNPINGFTNSASIDIEGLPAGVSSSPISPFAVAAGASQSVVFSASTLATVGDYNLTFRGTSGTLTYSLTLTLTVVQQPLADFSVSVTPPTISLPANGTASVQACVNATTSGSTNYTVDLSYSTLPQEVTGVFDSSAISLGQCATLTLTATKDAPAVSGFSVTATATRASDGIARTAELLLTVTRITLGGGVINFIPTDTTGAQWSPETIDCFNQFMAVAYPAMVAVAGEPSNNIDVAVKVTGTGGGAYNHDTNVLSMGQPPDTSGGCGSDPGWYALFFIEATHAFHDGISDFFDDAALEPVLPAYIEIGSSRFVMVDVAHYLRRKNFWIVAGSVGIALGADAYHDVGAEVLGGVRAEGRFGGPVENSAWQTAAAADLLVLHLGESACSANETVENWEIDCTFHRRLYERFYAFMNTEQRLPTEQEYLDFVAQEALPATLMDGMPPRDWYAGRSATFSSGVSAGPHLGVVTLSRVMLAGSPVKAVVQFFATTLAGGVKTPITSGTALLERLDVDGNVVFSTTHDLAVSHEISTDVSALQPGAYTDRVTFNVGGQTAVRTNVFMVVPFQYYWDGMNFPGTYVIATQLDADGNLQAVRSTFSVTPVWSANGAALVGDSCGNLNPCSIAVNGVDITVPLPLPRIVAVPAIP